MNAHLRLTIFTAIIVIPGIDMVALVLLGPLSLASVVACVTTLSVLCVVSLWLKHSWAAAWCAATVVGCGCLAVEELSISTSDGIVTVPARLTVAGFGDTPNRAIRVSWVVPGAPGWQEIPWTSTHADHARCEFTAAADLMLSVRSTYFRSSAGWAFYGQPPILIRVGGDEEFAFLPDELLTATRFGMPPTMVAGSVDIGDYLSGKKRCRTLRALEVD